MTNRSSRVEVSIPLLSADGKYYGRYPLGNAPGALAITVVNGALVNAKGMAVYLRGGDTPGMEGSYALGGSPAWDYGGWTDNNAHGGTMPPFAQMASAYKWNAFRVPLHVQSILGFTAYKLSGLTLQSDGSYNLPTSLAGLTTVNMDPNGTYLSELDTAVAAITAAGCYAILDLHLWAPDAVIGGTTVHVWNASQDPGKHMPDQNAVTALAVIAARYKNYPNVIFDLVNEPTYPTWSEWSSGTTYTQFDYNDGAGNYYGKVNSSWTSVGMSQLLNAVRVTAGATNVCMLGGVGYSGILGTSYFDASGATWLSSVQSFAPSDTQICASIHLYPSAGIDPAWTVSAGSFVVGRNYQIVTAGTTSFTAIGASNNNVGTQFTATGAGSGTGTALSQNAYGGPSYHFYYSGDNQPSSNGYAQWILIVQNTIAAKYPVVAGELGGQSMGTGSEPFVTNTINEIDALNSAKAGTMHSIGWGASPYIPVGTNFQLFQYPGNATYTVTTDYGAVYTVWTSNHS